MGETIAFSMCNKPFKPLGIPSGRVKSYKGFSRMTPTNNYWHCVINQTKHFTLTHGLYIISKFNMFKHMNHIIRVTVGKLR